MCVCLQAGKDHVRQNLIIHNLPSAISWAYKVHQLSPFWLQN